MEARTRKTSTLKQYIQLLSGIFDQIKQPQYLVLPNSRKQLNSSQSMKSIVCKKMKTERMQQTQVNTNFWRKRGKYCTNEKSKTVLQRRQKKQLKQLNCVSILYNSEKTILKNLKKRINNFHDSASLIEVEMSKLKEKEMKICGNYIQELMADQ